MTTRYVGIGGNNANDGLSWANRKATLTGAEDTPVVAGDVVYVGPGVYRELLTIDVSGSGGSPITYIGDVTGEHTDGVGGLVRLTGSDDDTTGTRANIMTATSKDYRTFRGFVFDTATQHAISIATACGNWIFEDCVFHPPVSGSYNQINMAGTGTTNTVRRCLFLGGSGNGVLVTHSGTVDSAAHLFENNVFFNAQVSGGLRIERVGGITVRHNLFFGGNYGLRVATALSTGQTTTCNNNIFYSCIYAMAAVTAPATNEEITENYNALWANGTARTNVSTGANSNAYPPLFDSPLLLDGFIFPWMFGKLGKWSQVARIAGASGSTDDLFGLARPATESKKSWGPIQYTGAARETTTIDGASGASIKLPDAGEVFVARVPVAAESTTISIKVNRAANYAGTNPAMVIRQPGQSDRTTTDTGSASAWNTLTDTFTPSATPPYVDVFVVSSNTATSGAYSAYADTLAVS